MRLLRLGRPVVVLTATWACLWALASAQTPATTLQPGRSATPPTRLDPLVVSATRAPTDWDALPLSIEVVTAERLRASPASTLDATLRESAAFSLFRRSSSLTANPTAQGVSLRGLGPSGASRSLVLLDGVPLNDPFGGWVQWSKIPRLALAAAEIVRGGGSGTWGNAALGGTVALLTTRPEAREGAAADWIGDFSTYQGELTLTQPTGAGAVRINAQAFQTGGTYSLAPTQRGPLDRTLDAENQVLQATWRQPWREGLAGTLTARAFREERGNGTPLQRNASREGFLSYSLGTDAAAPGSRPFSWNASAYAQRQHFESFFSSVDTLRQTETPANDQFDVPAAAAGLAGTVTWRHASHAATVAGADLRWVRGETRENYTFTGGRFTRQRFAGGQQEFGGLFLNHDRPVTGDWRASLAVRVDQWRNDEGHRREIDSATGAILRDDHYSDGDGTEFSPRVGLTGPLANHWRGRAAAYRAFRLPTLNEYYRPFRVGNVNTEANPALRRETVDGAEAGGDYHAGPFRTGFTAFLNQLNDAVANVTLARTSTLTSRQRRNLQTVRVRGVEWSGEWTPVAGLILRADYLLNDSRVRSAPEQPALTGLRLAQVPRQTITAGVTWSDRASGWSVDVRVRHTDTQFEDDENTLRLAAATVWDARVSKRFTSATEAFVGVENAGDEAVETGRSAEGLINYDVPRRFRAGLQMRW